MYEIFYVVVHCLYRGGFIIVFMVFSKAVIIVLSVWTLLRSAVHIDSFSYPPSCVQVWKIYKKAHSGVYSTACDVIRHIIASIIRAESPACQQH